MAIAIRNELLFNDCSTNKQLELTQTKLTDAKTPQFDDVSDDKRGSDSLKTGIEASDSDRLVTDQLNSPVIIQPVFSASTKRTPEPGRLRFQRMYSADR